MPIYKASGKKAGLQKYNVRINYIDDNGQPKQLTRIAYGSENAKDLELRLRAEYKVCEKSDNKKVELNVQQDEEKLKNQINADFKKQVEKMTVRKLFDEYIEAKTAEELRETTLVKLQRNFISYIFPIFKNYQIDRITAKDVQDWKIFMNKKNLALGTRKTAFKCFSAMMNYAVEMEYLQKNPFAKRNFKDVLSIKPEMSIYTPKEFKKFIKSAKKVAKEKEKLKKDLSEWNYYVFFSIAFYTGLRKGEIHALKWSDIDGSYLSVKRSLTQRLKGGDRETAPKNKSSIRTLQMPLPLMRVLKKQKQRQKRLHSFSDDFRICSSIRDTTIQKRNDMYSQKAGLKTIRIHDFRHPYVKPTLEKI